MTTRDLNSPPRKHVAHSRGQTIRLADWLRDKNRLENLKLDKRSLVSIANLASAELGFAVSRSQVELMNRELDLGLGLGPLGSTLPEQQGVSREQLQFLARVLKGLLMQAPSRGYPYGLDIIANGQYWDAERAILNVGALPPPPLPK